ncbi:MAG: response regulator [Candidatus Hydrogenedentes bacterium]|nr:response regulator [Candidatus Hydrogenedentota bacterium]
MNEAREVEILLVEDSPTDAELALRALRKQNLANKVTLARDGVEAVTAIFGSDDLDDGGRLRLPRLILLDLNLPRMNGLEVLQRVKSDPRTRHVPVVVLTSSQEERDVIESYELGVNSYIIKPVDFDKFMDAVGGLGFYWLLLNRVPRT